MFVSRHGDVTLPVPDRGEALQRREALLPRGGGLLEGLVPLEELLHLVHRVADVSAGHVRLLGDKPRLRHRGVARKLTHLQHWEQRDTGSTGSRSLFKR